MALQLWAPPTRPMRGACAPPRRRPPSPWYGSARPRRATLQLAAKLLGLPRLAVPRPARQAGPAC
eukprot:6206451-Pleurochrysis_carterae.AAC.1